MLITIGQKFFYSHFRQSSMEYGIRKKQPTRANHALGVETSEGTT